MVYYLIKTTQWEELKGTRRFLEVILSVDVNGNKVMVRCLLDTGCTKSMILKKYIDKKQQTKLMDKDSIKYLTYSSTFKSSMTAILGIKMAEFESQKNNTIKYKFQVDEILDPYKQLYDVILEIICYITWVSTSYSRKDRYSGMMIKFRW